MTSKFGQWQDDLAFLKDVFLRRAEEELPTQETAESIAGCIQGIHNHLLKLNRLEDSDFANGIQAINSVLNFIQENLSEELSADKQIQAAYVPLDSALRQS